MSKFCFRCGSAVQDDAAFCIRCGAPQIVQPAAFCPRCGSRTEPGTSFCPVCGSALQPVRPAQPAIPMTQPAQPSPYAPPVQPVQPAEPVPAEKPAPDPVYSDMPDDSPTVLLDGLSPFGAAEPDVPAQEAPAPDPVYSDMPDDSPTVLLDGLSPFGAAKPDVPVQEAPVQTAPKAAADASDTPVQKPYKKKSKKWLFIGIGAGVIAVLSVVFFVFILPLFGSSSCGDGIVIKNGGSTYYSSPYMLRMDGDDLTQVKVTGIDGNEKYFGLYPYSDVQDGDTIYSVRRNYGYDKPYECFVKAEFTSKDAVKESAWVVSPALENVSFNSKKASSPYEWIYFAANAAADGKYAYYTLLPGQEHIATRGDVAGKVVRISLDGKTVEQFSDINALDLAIDGSWIYYFDAGYNPGEDNMSQNVDTARTGIYKIKTDGSSKQLIHAMKLTDEQVSLGRFMVTSPPCGDLKIIGGKLYFIDYTDGGQGKLARMDEDGQNFEYLTAHAVRRYAVDTDRNTVYYYSGKEDDAGVSSQLSITPELIKCDLKTKAEIAVPTVAQDMNSMTYYDGYLYFTSYNFRYENNQSARVGLRMNVSTGQWQWASGYRTEDSGWKTDPDTGRKTHYQDIGEPQPSWVPAETR